MFEHLGLGTILKRYKLIVPPNQRDYSWGDKEVKTLLQDFAKSISDGEGEYFLGTIVGVDKTENTIEIVDGQQRLATALIFLCEIRNYLKDKDNLIADDISTNFLTDVDRIKREQITKMQLNSADNEYFKSKIILNRPIIPQTKLSHELIEEAFNISKSQINSIVSGYNEKDHGDQLVKWVDFIEYRAKVILLTVSDSVNAYKMFETLNDRGLKTSQADLVKNYLFGQSDKYLSEAQQKWSMMRGALETVYDEDMIVTFLRHVLIVLNGHITAAQVFNETQKIAKGATNSLSFLDQLEKFSQIYVSITNPENEKWGKYSDSVQKAIKTLNRFDIKPFYPILMVIADKFKPNEVSLAMNFLISLGVRLIIASRTTSGSVEEPISNSAHEIFLGNIKSATELKKQLKNIIPSDQDFSHAFENARVSKASLARYYLRSLEMTAQGEPTPWFIPNDDKETITLEHVLPEKPGGNWPHFTAEAVNNYYRRLGNMVLLKRKSNSRLKSADFETKKKEYKKSIGYILTEQVSNISGKWTEKEIESRQKKLAELSIKTWTIL